MKRTPALLLTACAICLTTTMADGIPLAQRSAYEYSAADANHAAAQDLERVIAPLRRAGALNRPTADFMRSERIFRRLSALADQRYGSGHAVDWRLFVAHERVREAYSRGGGAVFLSSGFLEHYRPSNAELELVIGHEIAHVLCEHERMKLSAVWYRNAPYRLAARHAIEYLDTEPAVGLQVAPMVRVQERIADRLSLALAMASGTDPGQAVAFFDKSAADEGGLINDAHDHAQLRKAALLRSVAGGRLTGRFFHTRETDCAP